MWLCSVVEGPREIVLAEPRQRSWCCFLGSHHCHDWSLESLSGPRASIHLECYGLFPFSSLYDTIRHNWLLRGLACMTCTRVSSRTGLSNSTMTRSAPLWPAPLHYDSFHSTMTCSMTRSTPPRPALPYHDPNTLLWRRRLIHRYKGLLLGGMSSECSWFIVLQSEPSSPLFSIPYLHLRIRPLSKLLHN